MRGSAVILQSDAQDKTRGIGGPDNREQFEDCRCSSVVAWHSGSAGVFDGYYPVYKRI